MILSFGPSSSGSPLSAIPLVLLSGIALVGYVLAALPGREAVQSTRSWQRIALTVGWIAHGLSIVADTAGLGSSLIGARFGFAPALSVTLWLVLAVYAVESRFVPLTGVRRWLAVLGATAVVLAMAFPGDVRPQADSPYAPIHWVLGIASYGLFGAAVLHGIMLNMAEGQMRLKAGGAPVINRGLPLLRLEKLTFRFVAAGFVTLSATLVLAWWFARPWYWDHKTVFSVLAWVVFAALLMGRRAFGWRGRLATRWLYFGALMLLLGYVGSRFVLEVVLHRQPMGQ
jgi:ABC-type uncharacterized transport system permease subunit